MPPIMGPISENWRNSLYFQHIFDIKQQHTMTGTFRNEPVQRETEAGHLPAVLRMTALPPHGLHPATVFLFIKYINILKNSLSFCTVFSPRSKKIVCLLIRNNGLDALE